MFLIGCVAITIWMVFDSGKSDQVMMLFEELTLPNGNEMIEYFGQGFYYVALLIGVVYLGRKIKKQRKNTD